MPWTVPVIHSSTRTTTRTPTVTASVIAASRSWCRHACRRQTAYPYACQRQTECSHAYQTPIKKQSVASLSKTPEENRGQKYKMPEFAITVGSKAQVFHGTAKRTSGGLEKKDLVQNKHGRIVSRRKQAAGKKALKFLIRKGYKTRKGHFHLFNKYRRMTRRQQGGFF